MAWNEPRTWVTNEVLSKALLDEQVRDNLAYLKLNIALEAAGELTISAGAVTKSRAHHTIDTESDAASDDLASILGGAEGEVILLRAAHTDRTVVLKTGTGNIINPSGTDITLNDTNDYCLLAHNGTNWIVIGGGAESDLAAHVAAADPHTGYVLESLYDAYSILMATSDDTPIALTVNEQEVIGRMTGGTIDGIALGIADDNIVQMDDAGPAADNDYAKFTANGLEGRSYSEVKSDLTLNLVENTAHSTDAHTMTIDGVDVSAHAAMVLGAHGLPADPGSDKYLMWDDDPGELVWADAGAAGTVDTSGTPVANDIARFTDADTIEGRSYAEFKSDLDLEVDTDMPSMAGAMAIALALGNGGGAGGDIIDATSIASAGAVMEADYNAQTILAATTDNTPAALEVTEQTLVGRLTGGNVAAVAIGIADNNIVQIDDAGAADNEYARFTAAGIEGVAKADLITDLAVLKVADIDDTPVNGEVAQPISSNWAYDHAAAADPHAGYVLESLYDADSIVAATTDNTPAVISLAEQRLVGRLTGGHPAAIAIGIANDNIVQIDDAGAADNEYARFTAAGIEGVAKADLITDLAVLKVADIDDTPVNGEVAQPISSNWAYDHAAAADPHAGYVLESLYDADSIVAATTDNTPAVISLAEQRLVGRLTGGHPAAIAIGIANDNIVQIDDAGAADNEYAQFTASGLEGRSYSELRSDIGVLQSALVYKTSNQVINNSDVLANDSELLYALEANKTYSFELFIVGMSNSTPDFKCAMTSPAASTIYYNYVGKDASGTMAHTSLAASAATFDVSGLGTSTIRLFSIRGLVINGANAGNLTFQWCQNTATALDTTICIGSHMIIWKLN
jgi:hypothetical protein